VTSAPFVVDCDVHHTWATRKELLPYFDEGWREFATSGNDDTILPYTSRSRFPLPGPRYLEDAFPENGVPGSDRELLRKQLDDAGVAVAILTHEEGRFVDTNPNPHYAAAFARACNDWTVAEWLAHDPRLYGSIVVSNQLPSVAAEEIRRMGGHPQMKQVLMTDNAIGKHFGHPLFDPIHAAAAEVGLPIAIHAPSYGGVTPAAAGQGAINYFLEYYALVPETFMSHLTSFITNGVFDRYPSLKVVLVESGVAWIPPYLWRLDANYKGLRREIPWTQRLPSEHFKAHVRVSLNPPEAPADPAEWLRLVEALGGPDVLVFGSGYPQWDAASVAEVRAVLPEPWLARVFAENAVELYSLGADVIDLEAAPVSSQR
jgi:predicted TIM-barrel fold metal-dependent hydrolase